MPPLFLHRISIVRLYLYIAATTPDPAGWDLRHPTIVNINENGSHDIDATWEPKRVDQTAHV